MITARRELGGLQLAKICAASRIKIVPRADPGEQFWSMPAKNQDLHPPNLATSRPRKVVGLARKWRMLAKELRVQGSGEHKASKSTFEAKRIYSTVLSTKLH